MSAKLLGISPSSPLEDKSSSWRRVRFPRSEGICPSIKLWERFNATRLLSDVPRDDGIEPVRLFADKFIEVKA